MKKIRNVFGLLCLLVWMNACASSGSIQMVKQKTVSIPPGSTVSLSVTATLPDDADEDAREDASEVTHRLKSQLFGRLVSEAVFKQVLQPGEQADYRMDVKLINAKVVSVDWQNLLGLWASPHSLTALISLHDQATDSLITTFEVAGKSGRANYPREGQYLDTAIREAVDEIIFALR